MIRHTYVCDLCDADVFDGGAAGGRAGYRLKYAAKLRGETRFTLAGLGDAGASELVVCAGCLKTLAEEAAKQGHGCSVLPPRV